MWLLRARAIWTSSCTWSELGLGGREELAETWGNGRERAQYEQRCERWEHERLRGPAVGWGRPEASLWWIHGR